MSASSVAAGTTAELSVTQTHNLAHNPAIFSIAHETPADSSAREALLDRVMGEGRKRKSSEKLRRKRVPAFGAALVARDDNGAMVGTVRLWHISAGKKAGGEDVPALLLGPLAVEDAYAGRGVGSGLMRQAIRNAQTLGHKAILLVGDPEYYSRFGFIAAKTSALAMPGPVERHRFLALELEENYLDGASGVLTATGKLITERQTLAV
ncbi:N-acetyltransferase [Ochrobactrum sp. MR28]|nr:N-acetyltransferase [Ochrobactrum sp. MR28]MBX8817291.1 N-acetyltransferase [Ochrobactrum sp. MR31]